MPTSFELKDQVQQIVADERGTIFKDAPIRVALVYPSPYRAGMSSLGFQVIYGLINDRQDTVAERAFLPEDGSAWRESRTPLFTYESETPVGHVDIVGFSLAYELEITGVIACLELAGIPVRASERTEADPLVILGGPITFSNPLPAAPFADVVVMGEGEEATGRLLDHYADVRDRAELLERLAREPGLYVPAIHGERLLPVVAAPDDALPARGRIRTPHTELRDMHLVESERGCHRKCTFCVMRRSTNRGMRLASPSAILDSIPDDATRVGLVGAAVSDHPKLIEIVRSIVEGGRDIGLSSLRADRLTPELMELLAAGGYRTLTVASDGASERLRISLQKAIREKHLFRAAEYAREYGMRYLKLYMMIGVPGETDDDIAELVELASELSTIVPVALGVAPFVSKRNTPLDRVPFAGVKQVERTLATLRRELRGRVDVRSTSARWAWVEWCLAQGGFEMAEAALEAHAEGGGFSAWKRAIRKHRRDTQPADEALRLGLPEGPFAAEAYSAAREPTRGARGAP